MEENSAERMSKEGRFWLVIIFQIHQCTVSSVSKVLQKKGTPWGGEIRSNTFWSRIQWSLLRLHVKISGLPQSESPSDADNKKVTVDDEEFARMMSRFDELEKEELEAERANNHETEQTEDDISDYKTHHPLHQSLRNSAVRCRILG